ncbi:MAG: TolC family protein [Alphaproteobacteria bacterium]|nr:TolC family protein [Alphaproteobacteria bacterium]
MYDLRKFSVALGTLLLITSGAYAEENSDNAQASEQSQAVEQNQVEQNQTAIQEQKEANANNETVEASKEEDKTQDQPVKEEKSSELKRPGQWGDCEFDINKKLTLEDLRSIGICKNPDLRRGYMSAKAAESQVGSARAAYFPTLNLNAEAGASHYKGQFRSDEANIQKDSKAKPYSVNLALHWMLIDFGRGSKVDMYKAYKEVSRYGFNSVWNDTLLGINGAYLDLLSAQETLESAKKTVEAYKEFYEETEKKFNVGKANKSDLLLAKTTYLKSQLQVTSTENTIEKNRANLARLLNMDPDTKFELEVPEKTEESISLNEETTISDYIKIALENRPELQSSKQQEYATEKAIGAAKANFGPTLAFVGKASYSDRWKDNKPFKEDGYPWKKEGYVGLALDMPLFNGLSDMYNVQKAKYENRAAKANIKSTEDMVKSEVWDAYQDYKTALESFRINGDVLASAVENERVSHVSYRAGKETLLNLLTIQARKSEAEIGLIVSFYGVLYAKANLYRAVGNM